MNTRFLRVGLMFESTVSNWGFRFFFSRKCSWLKQPRKICFECVVIDHDPEDNLDKDSEDRDLKGTNKESRNSTVISRVEKSEQREIWYKIQYREGMGGNNVQTSE